MKTFFRKIAFASALLALPLSLQAASFDCKLAQTKVEKTVCADKELSVLDERMAAAYKERLKDWQGKIEAYVKADQRQWLGMIRFADKPAGEIDPLCPAAEFAGCLKSLYNARVNVLESKNYLYGGVYRRGDTAKLLLWPSTGKEFNAGVLVRGGTFRRTEAGIAHARVLGPNALQTELGDGSGLPALSDDCRLDLAFADLSVQVRQTGKCLGADYSGTYARDLKDLLANYELDIHLD